MVEKICRGFVRCSVSRIQWPCLQTYPCWQGPQEVSVVAAVVVVVAGSAAETPCWRARARSGILIDRCMVFERL